MTENSKKIQQKLFDLREKIHTHDYQYYVLDRPQITDFEYDGLFSELRKLEKEHPDLITADSPTQRVSGVASSKFLKIKHSLPMLSLQNSYSPEDIIAFDARVKKFLKTDDDIAYFCEPKFDGLAIELVYKDGVLTHAITRGDGTTGEDVLPNVRTIKSVPLRLQTKTPPELIEIRGEILIFKKDFLKLNEQQQEDGEEPFANPRNAAAGTIRQLDPQIASKRHLHFFAYALGLTNGIKFTSQSELGPQFEKWGVPVTKLTQLGNKNDALAFYKKIESLRHDLDFDIDGIVVKVDRFELQGRLDYIARSPRWATAAKFTPDQAITKIKDIVVQVGRTGALTPVAVMEPVEVGGVTINHATLHNQGEIDRKDIRIGDYVLIHRAGDVIPEIIQVISEKRPNTAKKFNIPNICPVCHSDTLRLENEAVSRCINPACEAKLRESLKHFVSKRAMNIEKLGDKMVDLLVNEKIIHCFSDIYKISYGELIKLERQGEKSVQNLLDSIKNSKHTSLARFIYALGIRFVGEQTSKELVQHFGSLDNIRAAKKEDFLKIDGIGEKVAFTLAEAFSQKPFLSEIDRLLKQGLVFEQQTVGGVLNGRSFVITGTLPKGREEVKSLIESLGGHVQSSVSKKTTYLLAGDEAGSKLSNAQKLKIPIINWDQFLKMIE